MARQIEQTGKTISEAVEAAAKQLGVDLADVDYKILDAGSKGFLGFGAKLARVLVTVNGEEEAKEEPKEIKPKESFKKPRKTEKPVKKEAKEVKKDVKPEPKKEVKPELKAEPAAKAEEKAAEPVAPAAEKTEESARAKLTDEDKKIILGTAVSFLTSIFETMDMEVKIDASFIDNKQIMINVEGEEMGTIIGKRGQTLDSLQYLTNLVVNKGEYAYMNVTIDTENYRLRRKETLEHLAFNLAKKAKHNRRNVTLEPMNPYERRIIHATLQNDRYVTTYSEGVEPYRYVVIALKNNYSSKRRYSGRSRSYNSERAVESTAENTTTENSAE